MRKILRSRSRKGCDDGDGFLSKNQEAQILKPSFPSIQKGGDPAAGSPTATLLRLHPSR